jgi:arylsulfatase A-like enzyme
MKRLPWFFLLLWLIATPVAARMNVVVILTDDQRFDSLDRMPNVTNLAANGVKFTNAYNTTPVCGPSRAVMFSGGFYPRNTGVLTNNAPNGGAQLFNDRNTLGTVLQSAGYRTAFVGKWVNGYEAQGRYVPPGWTRWLGRHSYATTTSWSAFQYVRGTSSATAPGTGTMVGTAGQYTTDYERDRVLEFIDASAGQPFFVLWAPSAPHASATPAAADGSLYQNYVYRDRGYGETDLSDKPRWVRSNTQAGDGDEFVRRQMRTLQSVDRAVGAIVARLGALGVLNNTMIVFTSDNGYMWGEHGLWEKTKIYEESARAPLIVRMPGVAARTDANLVSPGLDLGPTVYELAGVQRASDGDSLVALLRMPGSPWRGELLLDNTAAGAYGNAIWAALRSERWKYVRYWTGEEELYDLYADPYELRSLHRDAGLQSLKSSLAARTMAQVGLAIIPLKTLPAARLATSYRYALKPWGGVGPLSWRLESGRLPQGLRLEAGSGAITGAPAETGTFEFAVRVTDSVIGTQSGRPRTFVTKPMLISVQ